MTQTLIETRLTSKHQFFELKSYFLLSRSSRLGLCSLPDALTLQLHNYQNPFIVDEGVASEIIFSIHGADDLTNYRLALAQETTTSFYTRCSLNVSSVHCWEVKRDDCQCVNLGQGRRRFKLTVTFEASHVGQWMFAVWSHNVTPVFFNVTFVGE